MLSDKPTKLKRKEVIEYFGGKNNFVYFHNQNLNIINDLIIE